MKQFTFIVILCSLISVKTSCQILVDEKRVIFPQDKNVTITILGDSSFGRFTPTLSDIDSVDLALQQYFFDIGDSVRMQMESNIYYRQYVGLLFNGKKFIFINAACRKPPYYLENTYGPKGGGKCFFRTMIDINDKKVSRFMFNAPR